MRLFDWLRRPSDKSGDRNVAAPRGNSHLRMALSGSGKRVSEAQWADIYGNIQKFEQYWTGATPTIDQRLVNFMGRIVFLDPNLSAARRALKSKILTKMSVIVEDRSESEINKIHQRLNELAERVNSQSGGIYRLAKQYTDQLITSGAISSEDVVAANRSMVQDVVIVPVANVGFEMKDGRWMPFQRKYASNEKIWLDEKTYRYLPAETAEGAPYAIPLFISAVRATLMKDDADESIRFIMRKIGLMGIVRYLVNIPEDYDYTNPDDRARLQNIINQRIEDLDKNFHKGICVGPNDGEMDVTNPAGDARGSYDLYDRIIENQFAGTGMHGGLIGQSHNPVQTFATVIFRDLVQRAEEYQGIVARALDETNKLDLALGGIDPRGVHTEFEENPAFDPLAEAQARTTEQAGDIRMMQCGLVSPDEVAQKYYGKPAWDPSLFQGSQSGAFLREQGSKGAREQVNPSSKLSGPRRVELKLNQQSGRYEVSLQVIRLISPPLDPPPETRGGTGGLKSALQDGPGERRLESDVRKYMAGLRPSMQQATEEAIEAAVDLLNRSSYRAFAGPDDFARSAWETIARAFKPSMESEAVTAAVANIVEQVYEYWRKTDASTWGERPPIAFSFSPIDFRTLEFTKKMDRFWLGKFIEGEQAQRSGLRVLEDLYLEHGAGLFGRADRAVLQAFRDEVGTQLDHLSDYRVQAIADTSIVRLRSYGRINQYREAGIENGKWITVGQPCEICNPYNGKEFSMAPMYAIQEREINMTPEQFESWVRGSEDRRIGSGSPENHLAGGAQPPLHPNCRCMIVGVV